MNAGIQKLLRTIFIKRVIVIAFLNLIFSLLMIFSQKADVRVTVALICLVLDAGVVIYLRSQHLKIRQAISYPSVNVFVRLGGCALRTTESAGEWQRARIHFGEDLNWDPAQSDLEVEIGLSSVSRPNSIGAFRAKLHLHGAKPVMILNEEMGILATISGVLVDRREERRVADG